MVPQTPFCPCLLLNLSPTSGLLVWRIMHLIDNLSFVSEQSITRSTTVVSPSTPL
uniref:Uncharacterized protein n=1 Tax=Arundo donax TaxID=35708 RepID=A0A0A9CID1_ARUDO